MKGARCPRTTLASRWLWTGHHLHQASCCDEWAWRPSQDNCGGGRDTLDSPRPLVCLGGSSGPRVWLPVHCVDCLGFSSVEWGRQALPAASLGPQQRAQLVRVEGGEPREACLLFLKIQSSKQGWELPRRARPFSECPGAQEETWWFLRIFKNSPKTYQKFPVSPGWGSPLGG